MPSIINSSTSSGLVITGSTDGILQLQSNGTTIATISSTGLQQNVGAPAFSVNNNSSIQTISNNTNTKLTFSTKVFDTASCFDNVTNYRYTPNVAGYYQFTLQIRDNTGPASGQFVSYIYKNGSVAYFGVVPFAGSVGSVTYCNALIYMNGTTDYVEAYVSQNSGGNVGVSQNTSTTYFMGFLARSA